MFRSKKIYTMSEKLLHDLFQAYYDCRKHKRNTKQVLNFELHLEENIFKLHDEIFNQDYEVSPSTVFIIDRPVKREIFAADFRDRVVHHYITNKLNPHFEKLFIHDSYSCRKNKWTLFWIRRAKKYLRTVTNNYSENAYILKLDIAWFFMHIDHEILWNKLRIFIAKVYKTQIEEKQILLYLCKKIVFHSPQKNYIQKSLNKSWIGLPKNKSLFFAKIWKWLPLWNLTSQIFSNLYLHELDVFIKQELRMQNYGRYVDDFFLFHKDKHYLLACILKIQDFLQTKLKLSLHPKKIYFQHYTKWFYFLWSYIKLHRTYIWTRTKTNLYAIIESITSNKKEEELISMRQSINSYLWFLRHHDTYYLRKKIGEEICRKNKNLYFEEWYKICVIRMKYNTLF